MIISNEGIDINGVAEDGGLVDNVPGSGTRLESKDNGPSQFAFSVNPCPFNPAARISYAIPVSLAFPELSIFTQNGKLIRNLAVKTGKGSVTWDGSDASGRRAASGVYLVRLKAGNRVLNRKAVMIK